MAAGLARWLLERVASVPVTLTNLGLLTVFFSALCPTAMSYLIFYPTFRLVFGTLYPAYASYKAVRTKNVKEYVKWMMYWIVFALFTCAETFTDVFLSFWFPFYYEIKIILVLWLLSPATKGSSILYRKFVHPMLSRREQDIDEYIAKAKEQGYHTVLHLGTKGVNYATTVIMQTAIKGGGGLVQQLRRSYSLSDLSNDKDMADVNRNNKALSNIPDDDTDEADEGSIDPRLLRSRGYSPRRSASGSGRVEMYFPEVDVRQHSSRQREPSIPLSHIRSSEDVSSGYSSAEPLYAGHHPAKGEVQSREPLIRTASVGSTRSMRPKSSRGGVVSKRTPTTEDSERWCKEETNFPSQEEYSYYISSSLPSQLESIPLTEQSFTQEELLLLLQELRALKAQAIVSVSAVSESQLTEAISENNAEVCALELSATIVDNNSSSLSLKPPSGSSDVEPEYIASKIETVTESDGPNSSIIPVFESSPNPSEEIAEDLEMFVDADTVILDGVQEDGPKSNNQAEQVEESLNNEDDFIDADTEVDTDQDNAISESSSSVTLTPDVTVVIACSTHEDKTTVADGVQSVMARDEVESIPEVQDYKTTEEASEPLLTRASLEETDVSLQLGTSISLNASIRSSNHDIHEEESLPFDTACGGSNEAVLLTPSHQTGPSELPTVTDDLNASSETLKSFEEVSPTMRSEVYPSATSSTTGVQLPEQTVEIPESGKKDTRSGRYHKRLAPSPPEKYNELVANDATDLNKLYSSSSSSKDDTSEPEQVTEDRSQKNVQTAVKARLVLQPGIVKSVGPETSDSGRKIHKFISSSPNSKRKATSHSKEKQKGSAISRLLVMPKNQLGHFASLLPFWNSRDTRAKSAESVSSAGSDRGEQATNVLSDPGKENISQSFLPPPVRIIPMSSCSLEYLPYIGENSEFESDGMDRGRSYSVSDFKIRELSHSPPSIRRSDQLPK